MLSVCLPSIVSLRKPITWTPTALCHSQDLNPLFASWFKVEDEWDTPQATEANGISQKVQREMGQAPHLDTTD